MKAEGSCLRLGARRLCKRFFLLGVLAPLDMLFGTLMDLLSILARVRNVLMTETALHDGLLFVIAFGAMSQEFLGGPLPLRPFNEGYRPVRDTPLSDRRCVHRPRRARPKASR